METEKTESLYDWIRKGIAEYEQKTKKAASENGFISVQHVIALTCEAGHLAGIVEHFLREKEKEKEGEG
ncbi:MAG: hypothetical protein ACXVCP_00485 [Bdellovibrio sp.]